MRNMDYPWNHAEKKRQKAKMMEGVYGGPDYFAQREANASRPIDADPEDTEKPDQNISPPPTVDPLPPVQQDPRMFQAVYAGPDFFAQREPVMFQMAYAGPVPAPNAGAPGQYLPPDTEIQPRKWCHACGMTIDAGAKFCPECGAPQPRHDA